MTDDDEKSLHRARRWARRLALQALYQWDISGGDIQELVKQFSQREDILRADAQYFECLVKGVLEHAGELHTRLVPCMDRDLDRLDPVERTVLRCACFELLHCPEVPRPVVLSEAIRLTRRFGTEQGGKYVNAVLDRVARDLATSAA